MPRSKLALLLLAVPLVQLPAQGWIDVVRPLNQLRMQPTLVRVSSNVHAVVDGRVARFEVTERFKNTGNMIAEGTYLYPLPGEAVFSDFSLFQGEKELKGEMMAADQARSIYEGIVRRLKDPALLTLVGHGLIKAQVFPVQPGETRTVTLRFTELLARESDALRLRYAAGDRGDAPVTMGIDVRRETQFATPYSPTHQMTNERRDGNLHIGVRAPVHGDVDLVLPFVHGLVGGTVLTHAEPGEDGFALLFLSPPPGGEAAPLGRDLTLVVDISGSMSGEKIDQAVVAPTPATPRPPQVNLGAASERRAEALQQTAVADTTGQRLVAAAPPREPTQTVAVTPAPNRLVGRSVDGAGGGRGGGRSIPIDTISFTDAMGRLNGRLRLIDGMIPVRLEAHGWYVRVVYPGDLVLREELVNGNVEFQLVASRGFPEDSLARLRTKVRE